MRRIAWRLNLLWVYATEWIWPTPELNETWPPEVVRAPRAGINKRGGVYLIPRWKQ